MVRREHVAGSDVVVVAAAAAATAVMMTRVVAAFDVVVGNPDGFCYEISPP